MCHLHGSVVLKGDKTMIFCITVLRAIAAMVITNAHYTGVYPTDLIANGGLLGDVIFFAVSGFCLYNIKLNFGNWYLKRIVKVYPAPIIITAVYMLLGLYPVAGSAVDALLWYIYPTNYHFVASIVFLYIPFYAVARIDMLRQNLPRVMAAVLAVFVLIYILVYDKSYYHIDTVREPIIRFLFFEAMLLGAYFKQNFEKYKDTGRGIHWVLCVVMFAAYFVSKMAFSCVDSLSSLQIINQIILMVLLYLVLRCFTGINSKLEGLPKFIKTALSYLAEITLEIYVVQYEIIPRLAGRFPFPINWLAITASILIVASLLHLCVKLVNKGTGKLLARQVNG